MYKYKVILADDEAMIRTGLNQLLKEECPFLDIIGVCENGKQVLELLKTTEVDIVIVDIQMPYATGLDIAKYINDNNLITKVIIITGYRDFEYAKNALEYNVHSIQLKPIQFDALLEDIREIIIQINEQALQVFEQTRQNLQLRDIKRQDLLMLTSGAMTPDALLKNRAFLFKGIPLENRICALVSYTLDDKHAQDYNKNWRMIWQDMGENEDSKLDAYLLYALDTSIEFLMITQTENMEKASEWINLYAKNLKENMWKCYDISSELEIEEFVSIKDIAPEDDERLLQLYINYLMKNDIVAKRDLLKSIALIFSPDKLIKFIDKLSDRIKTQFGIDIPDVKPQEILSTKHAIEKLNEIDDIAQKGISDEHTKIVKIINFINENAASDISLDLVASEFHMNASYLSRMFREKTGIKFVDYLLKVRLNKAKTFLLSRNYSIQEVAAMSGYTNARYFSQVFKENVGLTPRQYMFSKQKED